MDFNFSPHQNVNIRVNCHFLKKYVNPQNLEFVFEYTIRIENNNNFSIQLLKRHWNIFDLNDSYRQVQGEGVVGLQPIILPNEIFEYNSFCVLRSEIGKMEGYYVMQIVESKIKFSTPISPFYLIADYVMN